MRSVNTIFLLWNTLIVLGQTVADFENFELPPESFLNGSSEAGGFESGNIFLPNDYNPEYDTWSGWAISNTTDISTPGYFNQYSAISGSGMNNSANYAVCYIFGESIIRLQNDAISQPVMGMYITNSTYAYLSMLEGDAFTKKFGGVTGNDPDFFLLTIRKYYNGELSAESVEFYLADFRFEDNSEDYIISNWTFIDLSSLGDADSLSFALTSSDVGQFGMNTPAYFCIDDMVTTDEVSTAITVSSQENRFQFYPNPVSSDFKIKTEEDFPFSYSIYGLNGRIVKCDQNVRSAESISLRNLKRGSYMLRVHTINGIGSEILIKN